VKLPAALGDLPRPLYFFDGYCVLCSGFVAFCLARDPKGRLKFASAQSALGQRVLKELGLPDGTLDRTILLLDGDEVHVRSAAVLRSLRWSASAPGRRRAGGRACCRRRRCRRGRGRARAPSAAAPGIR
jgi:predicted DCC family thiol-disulfide oxidoreductase YuxK